MLRGPPTNAAEELCSTLLMPAQPKASRRGRRTRRGLGSPGARVWAGVWDGAGGGGMGLGWGVRGRGATGQAQTRATPPSPRPVRRSRGRRRRRGRITAAAARGGTALTLAPRRARARARAGDRQGRGRRRRFTPRHPHHPETPVGRRQEASRPGRGLRQPRRRAPAMQRDKPEPLAGHPRYEKVGSAAGRSEGKRAAIWAVSGGPARRARPRRSPRPHEASLAPPATPRYGT
jgi:hypothetical protein